MSGPRPGRGRGDCDHVGARERVEAALAARLAAVNDEIRRYPAPIPACDAQFNHLLEQRAAIAREIARLRATVAAAGDAGRALDDFVASCPFLDAMTR